MLHKFGGSLENESVSGERTGYFTGLMIIGAWVYSRSVRMHQQGSKCLVRPFGELFELNLLPSHYLSQVDGYLFVEAEIKMP